MKLNFYVLLSLLCCYSCLSESSDGMPRDKIKITDLVLDVQRIIIEQMDFISFLNVAETNSSLSILAVDAFRQLGYKIYVYHVDSDNTRTFEINVVEKYIRIFKLDIILRTLKQFSNVIQYLSIEDASPTRNYTLAEITDEMTNGCRYDALKHLHMDFIENSTFDRLAITFPEVEELEFAVISNEITTSLPLNQQFPKLRRLSIGLLPSVDYSCLDLHFPFLEHLYLVAITTGWEENQNGQIEALLRKNPQIRSIHIDIRPFDFNKLVSQLLPNVQNLTVGIVQIEGDPVHFEHVKRFQILRYDAKTLDKLSFSCLESLEMNFSLEKFDALREFLRRHSNLSYLNLDVNSADNPKLVELTAEVPNLIEMTINTFYYAVAEDIIQLIESHSELIKLDCVLGNFADSELESVRNRLEDDWHIQYTERGNDWKSIIFTKKNN